MLFVETTSGEFKMFVRKTDARLQLPAVLTKVYLMRRKFSHLDDFEFTEHQNFKQDGDPNKTNVRIHRKAMNIIYTVMYRASVADNKKYSHITLHDEAIAVGQDIAEAYIYMDDLDDEDPSTHTSAHMEEIKDNVRRSRCAMSKNYFVAKVSKLQMKTIAGGVLMTCSDDDDDDDDDNDDNN